VGVSSKAAFQAAQRLEAHDRPAAARAYRAVANGSDSWAALALYSLAELDAAGQPTRALAALDEYQRRFPRGHNAEDAAWLRVDVLRSAGRPANAAAAAYLVAFPSGTYRKAAERLANAPPNAPP
jgi:outer membrane protein assembly factor BamD (BamD/ComL family)